MNSIGRSLNSWTVKKTSLSTFFAFHNGRFFLSIVTGDVFFIICIICSSGSLYRKKFLFLNFVYIEVFGPYYKCIQIKNVENVWLLFVKVISSLPKKTESVKSNLESVNVGDETYSTTVVAFRASTVTNGEQDEQRYAAVDSAIGRNKYPFWFIMDWYFSCLGEHWIQSW